MLVLYKQGGGSGGFDLGGAVLPVADERRLLVNAAKVMEARGDSVSAQQLRDLPFRIVAGSNDFSDEFCVLHATLPLELYEKLRLQTGDRAGQFRFQTMAAVVTELGQYTRFIAVELAQGPIAALSEAERARGLTELEIQSLVRNYIGVEAGYLADFNYESHRQFYRDLELPINPDHYEGTTRLRFEGILKDADLDAQATILRGVLNRFPVGSNDMRTADRAAKIRRWISRLGGVASVAVPELRITSTVVERALADAEHLIAAAGPVSGVDRIHTVFHGYLRLVCDDAQLTYGVDASVGALLGMIRHRHPAFAATGARPDDLRRVIRAMGAIADSLGPLRNQASVAHPNMSLLDTPEAMLVVNTVRTLLHYIDLKIAPPSG